MFSNKSSIIIFILLSLTVFSAYIQADIPRKVIPQNRQVYPSEKNGNLKRMLQAISSNDKIVSTSLTKIISDANSNRTSKRISSLSFNSSIGTIVSQWARALKGSLALTMYLQLYGIVNVQIETYASIPSEYVIGVVENLSLGLYDANVNQVSTHFSAIDNNNYEIIFLFQGNNAQTIDFSSQNIQSVINQIKDSQKSSPQISQLAPRNSSITPINSSQQNNKNTSSTSKVTIPINPLPTSTNITNYTQIQNATVIQTQTQASTTNTSATIVTPQPQLLPQNKQPVSSNQSNNIQIQNTSTQGQSDQNISVQQNATQSNTSALPTITPPPAPAPTPTLTPTPQPPVVPPSQNNSNTSQSGNSQKDQFQPQATSSPVQTASPVTQPSSNSSSQKQPSQSSLAKNSTSQANSLTYGQAQYNTALPLPLITQTTFTNTSSFAGILLTHGIPTTFLKNQIFPFKGYITVPNPSGIMVNVIFTRISDQQRLAFNQYLTANVTSFKILALLNMTGTYYLSIFAGSRGYTSLTQYTVSPGFIGQIVSRTPTPLSATLNLIKNDLWLNWTYSDVGQPALTSIIFTQGDFKVNFLLSNYETSFKVPYDQFWAFNSGITNIQISQAFSSNQSGNTRTSDFSAPYIIIFNATYHQFASIKNTNKFQPIPLKIPQGNNIQIVGPAGVQLQNKVYLLTPNKKFEQYFMDSNSSTQYIPKGTQVNLAINFNDSGVYILQVNDAGGEALINIPIYVGDIYPLVPDFVDLSPSYIDLAGLNQPAMIEDRRNLVLALLNSIRSSYGVQNLYLDKNLNNLAQKYSSYQIQNNFIGHVDLQGNTPGDRAAAAGILEGVGQNLAMNNNLTQAQLMLQRSPVHLQNMVNPLWTRVGLGIVQDANQFYYLTQQFSSRDLALYHLTDKQINGFQVTIVNFILSKYPYIQGEDKMLSNRLNAYQKMTLRPYIITYLQGLEYKNVAVANIQVNYNNGNFMNLIKNGNNFDPTSTSFKQVGLSIMYTAGNLEIFAAYI